MTGRQWDRIARLIEISVYAMFMYEVFSRYRHGLGQLLVHVLGERSTP
jgi:hypothetical protein